MFRYFKGSSEASSPVEAWRQPGFDDSRWNAGQAPFYYDLDGGPPPNPAFMGNTLLADMQNGYSSVYLRTRFFVPYAAAVTNVFAQFRCDDGLIAWINGVEVKRYHLPAGQIGYNGTASNTAEPLSTQKRRAGRRREQRFEQHHLHLQLPAAALRPGLAHLEGQPRHCGL